ncbi:AAA family ATPase [Arhodomonas aquaeolei]|uniref:AAA family ATPase n=1 Tax=Arhodomonas aquaeolei TaxID=2369 RepID=UPI0003636BDD|nr:AAA family ATPase [Arhodomonas aquaeolei]
MTAWIDMSDDLSREAPPIDWIVEGLLPAGAVGDIYGAPGGGKSTLALHLAAHVAAGRRTWFRRRLAGGPVLLVGGERSGSAVWARDMHRTAGMAGITPDELRGRALRAPADLGPLWAWDRREGTWLGGEALAAVHEQAAAVRPALIIMDTIGRVARGQDPLDIAQQQQLAERIEALGAATGAAVLSVSHTSQAARLERLDRRLRYEARSGSSGLPGHLRWLLGVTRIPPDEAEQIGLDPRGGRLIAGGVGKGSEMPPAAWTPDAPAILRIGRDGAVELVRDGEEVSADGGIAAMLRGDSSARQRRGTRRYAAASQPASVGRAGRDYDTPADAMAAIRAGLPGAR